jgi:hypothetical protein
MGHYNDVVLDNRVTADPRGVLPHAIFCPHPESQIASPEALPEPTHARADEALRETSRAELTTSALGRAAMRTR